MLILYTAPICQRGAPPNVNLTSALKKGNYAIQIQAFIHFAASSSSYPFASSVITVCSSAASASGPLHLTL